MGGEYLKLLELQNQQAAIAKWNGVMPSVQAGNGSGMMFQVGPK
jgi:hypothetical protein